MEVVREGEIHPLQNEHILEHIFKHLGPSDLKTVRLVCSAWRQHSSKAMRASVTVSIRDSKGPSQFLELVQSNERIFFESAFASKFIIHNCIYLSDNFWTILGSQFKTLMMFGVDFETVDAFRHAIFKSCPNLEYLLLHSTQVYGVHVPELIEWVPPQFPVNENLKTLVLDSMNAECGIVWMDIWSHFPCVETFRGDSINDCIAALFQSLEIARDPNDWKFKDVSFTNPSGSLVIPSSIVRVFTDGNISLTDLSMDGIWQLEDASAVQEIISANATSLKNLFLRGDLIRDPHIFPPSNNQVLGKLEKLFLGDFKMSSMRFSAFVPNLKEIILDVDWQPDNENKNDGVVLSNCNKLFLSSSKGCVEGRYLKKLHQVLPNLEEIWINEVHSDDFHLVCELWPKVVELEILAMPGKVDAGLSGFDKKDVKKINRRGTKGSWRPITAPRANLASLTYLQRFSLGSKPGHCGITYGILQLPQLKQLKITSNRANTV